jgi:hypothetical protein
MTGGISEMVTMKEQFDLLYANIKYYRDSSIDSVFKVAGFLIVVGGWLVTSRDARAFLASNFLIRLTAVAVILVIAGVYMLIAIRVLRDSRRTFDRLEQLSYMPTENFQEVLIRPSTILPFVFANTMISLALCVFILQFA